MPRPENNAAKTPNNCNTHAHAQHTFPTLTPTFISPNQDGDVTIIAGSDGSHVAFEIDGKRVNIDEIPEAMREYSNAAAGTLEVGYNMGKTTQSVSDTCEKLLVKLEGQVEKDIESLQTDVKGVESSVASTVAAQAASVDAKLTLVDTKIADSERTISASVDAKLKACVSRQGRV